MRAMTIMIDDEDYQDLHAFALLSDVTPADLAAQYVKEGLKSIDPEVVESLLAERPGNSMKSRSRYAARQRDCPTKTDRQLGPLKVKLGSFKRTELYF